jgi:5-methylcytosine-specific restriction protein A
MTKFSSPSANRPPSPTEGEPAPLPPGGAGSNSGRSLPEWVGKTDDEPVPRRVRARVFLRFDGICQECSVKIRAKRWICDHRTALINGGENRERNLGPIHEACDKTKTASDVAVKSKVARVRNKHLGLVTRNSRPMPGTRASGIRKRMNGNVETWR